MEKRFLVVTQKHYKRFKTINEAVLYYLHHKQEGARLYYKEIKCSIPTYQLKIFYKSVARYEYFYNTEYLGIRRSTLTKDGVPTELKIYNKEQKRYEKLLT